MSIPARDLLTQSMLLYPDDLIVGEPARFETARANDSRPAFVRLAIPDEVAKSLNGRMEMRGSLLIAWVPAESKRKILESWESAPASGTITVSAKTDFDPDPEKPKRGWWRRMARKAGGIVKDLAAAQLGRRL